MTRWCAAGQAAAVSGLLDRTADLAWPAPPPGFEPLVPVRAMRAVFGGRCPDAAEPLAVVLKLHRPLTTFDRIRRALRGGRGPREGRVLRRLWEQGLPVPEPLGYDDARADVLVTRRLVGLERLPGPGAASRALVERVARLLARLHQAGLVHRDLTSANLGLMDGDPVLVDLGGAVLRARPSARAALAHLAQAAHGLLHGASRAQAARGLRAWLLEAGHDADAWRAWIHDVERARLVRLRRHHRRRERRIARRGTHYALLEAPHLLGVRRVPQVPPAWETLAAAWIGADLPEAEALKGERVLALTAPDGRALVLKRYAPAAPGRRHRALRAFRRAVTLEERGLPVARALLAAWTPGGAGVLVSERVAAPDLDRVVRREPGYARWSPARRHAMLATLGRSLRGLHEAEVSHRDLKAPNLLVEELPTGWRFPIVDVDGVRAQLRPVSWARRARDLGRLAASLALSRAERLRILAAYLAVAPRAPLALRELAHAVHEVAQGHRRRLAAKAP